MAKNFDAGQTPSPQYPPDLVTLAKSMADRLADTPNYRPIFSRLLSQHTGIRIEFDFKTNDSTDDGQMSYVTVMRHGPDELGSNAVTYDGLGFAFRKQPQSVLNGEEDLKYNCFIVDEDALDESVYIGNDAIVETYGINRFLAAGRLLIRSNQWYSVRMEISTAMGIDVWMWLRSSGPPAYTDPNRVVFVGASYPPYQPSASGDHFGISVIETKAQEFWFDNILVESLVPTYPAFLFHMYSDPAIFADGEEFTLIYRGTGGSGDDTGSRVYVETQPAGEWSLVGLANARTDQDPAIQTLVHTFEDIAPFRDPFNFVNFLSQPTNSGLTHPLRTYYIAMQPYLPSGYHSNNMIDIYVNDPARIASDTITVAAGASTVLEDIPGIQLPIQEVLDVAPTGVPDQWDRNVDYTLWQANEVLAWSVYGRSVMGVNTTLHSGLPMNLDISYRYYVDGWALQSGIESDDFRYPCASNLGKVRPPCVVNFESFVYRYGIAADDMKVKLAEYINSGITDDRLEMSDLVNVAYLNGATYVDTANMTIGLRKYDLDGTLHELEFEDLYILSGENAFYTDWETEMIGVVRL